MLGERMIGRDDENQLIVAEWDGNDLAALGRIGNDAEIDFAFDQIFVDFVGA